MNPLNLQLENFLSYRQAHVDLTPVQLAALVGENGAGKSSLIDAITWALFGQSSKGGPKELDAHVTRGAAQCMVELEFNLGGSTYRVVRSRNIRRAKTTLGLYSQHGGNWESMSGKTVAETQARIEELLRMDYRTFTSSAVVLQGQADAFTADMTDQERKEVFGRILDLELWDRLLETVRAELRELDKTLARMRAEKERLEREVERKPEIRSSVTEVQKTLEETFDRLAALEEEVKNLERQVAQSQVLHDQLRETDAALSKVEQNERVLASRESRIYAKKRELQAKIDELAAKIAEAEQITTRRAEIEAAVSSEESLYRALVHWDEKHRRHLELQEELWRVKQAYQTWEQEKDSKLSALRVRFDNADRQAALLDKVPCSGKLRDACPLLEQARAAEAELEALAAEYKNLEDSVNPYLARLQKINAVIEAVAYDPKLHDQARLAFEQGRRLALLRPYLDQLDFLTAARTETANQIAELDRAMAELDEERLPLGGERAALESRRSRLIHALESAKGAEHRLKEIQPHQAYLESTRASLSLKLARLASELERISDLEQELSKLERDVDQTTQLHADLSVIERACSKKGGVPALVIENAVPEVERLANAILQDITTDRLQVRLDTQTEGKTTGAMQEVLRITILDAGQERVYRTYSGAERFIVDLALRLALGQFLAHRRGAEIGFFVLDEGLGVCDAANREAVVRAIEAVSTRFAKTLVVTHIEELQDALPQRLRVIKAVSGSQVKLEV